MQNTGKIVAWAVLAGLSLVLVIALVWGCEQRQASRLSPAGITGGQAAAPPPEAKWVANPAKKGWTKVDAAAVGGSPPYKVTQVRRTPEDVRMKPLGYTVGWSVRPDGLMQGSVFVLAGEGWERRAAEAIQADIAAMLALQAEEAKGKAAVEKARK